MMCWYKMTDVKEIHQDAVVDPKVYIVVVGQICSPNLLGRKDK